MSQCLLFLFLDFLFFLHFCIKLGGWAATLDSFIKYFVFDHTFISLWRETFSGYELIGDDDFTTCRAYDIIYDRCWMSDYLDWLVVAIKDYSGDDSINIIIQEPKCILDK